jgi:hypothetical protein
VTRTSSPFITIRSEGALLPPELLARIVDADKDLGGLVPTDYHLGETERLGEAIARSWNRLVGVWASFEPSLEGFNSNEPGTGVTRERWLAPLFQELGFGRLQVAKAREIGGTDYPISHEWGQVPIHLVGAGVELERRTKGVAGAARMSPHALIQDYLNRTEALWGIVTNGRELRLLRDNVSLTRQAYLAFDLEAMFSGEVYADFALLWLACHQSRFEPQEDKLAECWLERWTQAAQSQGTRALNTLREGVEVAISTLGAGFVAHPTNAALREALRSGELATAEYYRELLRLIYRLIFLFVAEDRALLHPAATAEEARTRYRDFYSMTRLRLLAERLRGGPHPDLWRSFVFVCAKLANDEGCDELGLPFLGSSLFSPDACPHLDAAEIANHDLLATIRALAFTEQRRVLRQIDYRNMGSEELGSIYESLLELHPEVHQESGLFTLTTAAGNERKTTGSYYTPTSLISALLDTALDPVLDEAASKPDVEAAILDVKVLDPACGSGHFLVAATHRIAKRLAAHRTDEPEPSLTAYRTALREVISRCAFGIDVNPMAVELCKVSLWMEAVEPGKPLSFLDHHIACGNSLLGTTPALLANGIPDEAFTALEGDDKETVKSLKARNKHERKGQASLFGEAAHHDLVGPIATKVAALEATPDDSPEALHAKQEVWEALEGSDQLAHAKLIADAWCAAFVIEKTPDAPVLTQGVLELLERNPTGGDPEVHSAIAVLADRYRFLHPHLAFPQVLRVPAPGTSPENTRQGWSGGFDLVVGNPPWEQAQLNEKEWFAARRSDIAGAPSGARRKKLIEDLAVEDPALHAAFLAAARRSSGDRLILSSSGRYPLCGRGRVNTYAVFAELMRSIIASNGRMGCVLPTGIATDDTTKLFFRELVDAKSLVSLFSFENEEFVFPAVHHATRFCLLTLSGPARPVDDAEFVFFARQASHLADPDRLFTLAPKDFELLNPNTRTCPIFRSRRDAELTKAIYGRVPVLVHEEAGTDGNPWGVSFKQGLFNMTSDSGLFVRRHELEAEGWVPEANSFHRDNSSFLPLYEAKMVHHFDHRFGTYEGQTEAQANQGKLPELTDQDHSDPRVVAEPKWWVPEKEVRSRQTDWDREWFLGWRDITGATVFRTFIAGVIPAVGVGNQFPLMFVARPEALTVLIANLSAFAFDYVARQKVGGTHVNFFILEQLPVVPPDAYARAAPWDSGRSLERWISPRVLELTYTAWDLKGFARDLGWDGAPFRWNSERRSLLRAELDAAYFHIYGVDRADASFVLDSFPIVRRNDEREHGHFRTKRLILERFDELTQAIETRDTYRTVLDPPPADPSVAHDVDD